jgi:hypothetical protein
VAALFPKLEARSLEGAAVVLPDGLEGDPSVVLVAFKRWQQGQVDSWMPLLRRLEERLPGLEVYEIPALSRRWLPGRRFIDGGMRAGISDARARRGTLTVYTNIAALLEALELDTTSAIAVFVIASNGSIEWRGRGAFQPDHGDQLTSAVVDASTGDAA